MGRAGGCIYSRWSTSVPGSQNYTIDIMVERAEPEVSRKSCPDPSAVWCIYQHTTENAPIRQLVVDLYVRYRSSRTWIGRIKAISRSPLRWPCESAIWWKCSTLQDHLPVWILYWWSWLIPARYSNQDILYLWSMLYHRITSTIFLSLLQLSLVKEGICYWVTPQVDQALLNLELSKIRIT
jgi:hypothetical protein